MRKTITLFWFRRDLRLNDNHGLYKALKTGKPVLPIFIFDKNILADLPKDDARVSFIYEQLKTMQTKLKKKFNSNIALFYGTPLMVFESLITKYKINEVHTNHDYEPYSIIRDKNIARFLETNNIKFKTYKDHVIFERNEIVKQDGLPYKVYTPYSKKWLELFNNNHFEFYKSELLLKNIICLNDCPDINLKEIGFTKSKIVIENFNINNQLLELYESTRNFPAKDSTSKLGPHLRFGSVSIREIITIAYKQKYISFLKELIWREFFMQILWHFPQIIKNSFKPKYDKIKWRNNVIEFENWCKGETGYPLVDAGMRQLNTTGFMHNRVRMLVGSFLCKHLLIDWRWGETYFALKLNDYELSSNIGNWQWVAGCGVDAAPYFRIFNPTTQNKKFDKEHAYIKKWVPDYQELTYPKQIIDHKTARERCLKIYKEALI